MPRNILIDPQRLGTGNPSIQFSGSVDNKLKLEVTSLGDLNFKNDVTGGSVLFVSGTGNVGIGSSSPAYLLDIAPTTATARLGSTLVGAWPANTAYAFFGHNSLTQTSSGNYAVIQNSAGTTFVNSATGNSLYLRINDTSALTIDSSRNVGIGTATTIGAKLHVYGGDILLLDAVTNTDSTTLKGYSTSDGGFWVINNPSNGAGAKLTLSTSFDWDKEISLLYAPGTTGAAAGVLSIGQLQKNNANWTHGVTRFYTNGTERMRIDSSGNVGVGTTAMDVRFVVSGGNSVFSGSVLPDGDLTRDLGSLTKRWANIYANSLSTPSISAQLTGSNLVNGMVLFAGATGGITGSQSQFFWDNTNNRLGIGTSSPGYSLDVNGNFNVSGIARVNEDAAGTKVLWLRSDYAGLGPAVHVTTNHPLLFLTNNTEKVRIDTTGRVGIGLTNPTAILHISGSVSTSANGLDVRLQESTASTLVLRNLSSNSYQTRYTIIDFYNAISSGDGYQTGRIYNGFLTGGNWHDTATRIQSRNTAGTLVDALTIRNTHVGIGNVFATAAAPTTRLLVSGSSTSSDQTMLVKAGVASPTGPVLEVQNSDGSTLLIVSGSGLVGIGTTSPGSQLTVSKNLTNGSVYTIVAIDGQTFGSTVNGNGLVTAYINQNTTWGAVGGYSNGTAGLGLWANTATGVPNVYVNSSGNVGIGTTTVGAKLDVNGSAVATLVGGNRTVPSYSQFEPSMSGTDPTYGSDYAYFGMHRAGNISWQIGLLSDTFVIAHGGGASQYTMWGNRRFSINSSGNVGIGITNATNILTINKGNGTGLNIQYDNSTNVRTGLFLFTRGSSIGGFSGGSEWDDTTTTARATAASTILASSGELVFYGNTGLTAGNTFSPTERARFNTSGHFVPGANNTYDLGLSGTKWRTLHAVNISGSLTPTGATAGSVFFAGASGQIEQDNSNFFWDDANNRLGIGTTNPSQRLDIVSGSMRGLYYLSTYDGELLAGADAGGYYYGTGFGKYTAIPMYIGSNATNIIFGAGSSERMRIIGSTGNVAIGAIPASALSRLYISGSSTSSTSVLMVRAGVASPSARVFDVYDVLNNSVASIDHLGNIYARSGSFSGDVSIAGNLTVLGVQTYVSSTVVDIGDNIITLNSTANPQRYGGLYINDTTANTTGSLLWDSDNNYWVAGLKGSEAIVPTGTGTNNLVARWTSASTLSTGILYDTTARVGINSSTPNYELDIVVNTNGFDGVNLYGAQGGASEFVGYRAVNPNNVGLVAGVAGAFASSAIAGANVPAVYSVGSIPLVFGTNSIERVRITSAGDVGIGTSSYTARLFVSGSTTGTTPSLVVQHGIANGSNLPVIDARNSDGTSLLFLSGSGWVGIGTNTPEAPLHINRGGGSTNTTNVGLIVDFEATAAEQAGGGVGILFRGKSAGGNLTNYNQAQIATANGGSNNAHGLAFYVKPNASTALTDVMWITSTGRIGIGTASPSVLLDVGHTTASTAPVVTRVTTAGGADRAAVISLLNSGAREGYIAQSNTALYIGNSGGTGGNYTDSNISSNANITISSAGFVGIGSTLPAVRLHVVGASILANNTSIDPDTYTNAVVAGAISDTGWAVTSGIGGNAGTGDSWAIGHNGSNLYFGIQNGTAADTMATFMQVSPGRSIGLFNNVGIGTTTPGYSLDVNGSLNVGKTTGGDLNFFNARNWYEGSTAVVGASVLSSQVYSNGRKLYPDETFSYGSNGIVVYDNAASGQITVTRISSTGLSPASPNNSGYVLQVQHTGGGQVPAFGGFTFQVGTRANATLVCVFKAYLPTGYTLNWASNATGTNSNSFWASTNSGTGAWQDYVYVLKCGASGTFSSTMFFYVTGSPTPSAGSPLTWYISSATVYDLDDKVTYAANANAGSGATNYLGKWTSASNLGTSIVYDNGTKVGIGTTDFTYTASDNTPLVGSITNNVLYAGGSIQLNGNNDAIVFGRSTSTFLKDEELGFGWGSGWYMTDSTWLRTRNNGSLFVGGGGAYIAGSSGIGGTGTNFTSRLLITGSGATSSTSTLHAVNSSGGSMMFIRDDGKVGIGTSTFTSTDTVTTLELSGSVYIQQNTDNDIKRLQFISNVSNTALASFESKRLVSYGSEFRLLIGRAAGGTGAQNVWKTRIYDDPTSYPNQNTHTTFNMTDTGGSNSNGVDITSVVYIGNGSNSNNTRPSLYTVNDAFFAVSRGGVGIGTTVTNGNVLSVTGSTAITGSVLPGLDNLYDLGSASKRWANIYATNFSPTSVSAQLTGSNLVNGMVLFAGATGGITGSQSQFFWNNTNNRLGIGTSSPSYSLDVVGDINVSSTKKFYVAGVAVLNTQGSNGGDIYVNSRVIRNESTALQDGMYIGYGGTGGSSAHLRFYANGTTERMRITAGDGFMFLSDSPGNVANYYRLVVSGSSTSTYGTALFKGGAPSPIGALLDVQSNLGSTFFVVSGSGNVGVGTGIPTAKFEVVGVSGSLFSVTDQLSGSLFSVNTISGLPILEVFSDNTVVAGAYSTNALVVTGSRVGMGTALPDTRLHVYATNEVPVTIRRSNSSGAQRGFALVLDDTGASTGYAGIDFRVGGTSVGAIQQEATGVVYLDYNRNSQAGGALSIRSNATETVRIDTNGYVYVGNISTRLASETVRISKSSMQNSILLGNTGADNAAIVGVFNDAASLGINRNPSTGGFVNTGKYAAEVYAVGSSSTSYASIATSAAANTAPTERMRVDASGNLTIGTAVGTAAQSLVHLMTTAGGDIPRLTFTNGTTGHTASDGSFVGISNGTQLTIWNKESSEILFATNNTERMRIDSSGRSVWSTGPSGATASTTNGLQIWYDSTNNKGYVRATQEGVDHRDLVITGKSIDFWNQSGASRMFLNSSGNVGIGTSTVQSYLDYTVLDIDNAVNGGLLNLKKNGATVGYINAVSGLQVLASSGNNMYLTVAGSNALYIRTSATDRMLVDSSGNLTPYLDNTYNLGSPTLRWANVYATSVTVSSSLGPSYTTPSTTSGTTAAFDTVAAVDDGAVYELMAMGNVNDNGDARYRDIIYGKIIIGTGYDGTVPAARKYITYVNESPAPRSIYPHPTGQLTADVVFFSGGVESTYVAAGTTTAVIRVKIAGYLGSPGTVGGYTTVRLKKLL